MGDIWEVRAQPATRYFRPSLGKFLKSFNILDIYTHMDTKS